MGCGFSQDLFESDPARLTLWFPYLTPSGFTKGTTTNWKFFLMESNSVVSMMNSMTPSKMKDAEVSPGCCLAMMTIVLTADEF